MLNISWRGRPGRHESRVGGNTYFGEPISLSTGMLLFPFGSGAVPDTRRELSADSLARAGVTGRDLAVQVASGNAFGLRGHPVPEPSSMVLFAGAFCWLARW